MTLKEIQSIFKSLEAVPGLASWRIIVLIFFILMLKDLQLILKFLEANPMLVVFLATIGLICFMVNVLLKVVKTQK